jgi:hypothetical protein
MSMLPRESILEPHRAARNMETRPSSTSQSTDVAAVPETNYIDHAAEQWHSKL